MTVVHILVGYVTQGFNGTPIRAYTNPAEAKEVLAKLEKHYKKLTSYVWNDNLYPEGWLKDHPMADDPDLLNLTMLKIGFDHFEVIPVPLCCE